MTKTYTHFQTKFSLGGEWERVAFTVYDIKYALGLDMLEAAALFDPAGLPLELAQKVVDGKNAMASRSGFPEVYRLEEV